MNSRRLTVAILVIAMFAWTAFGSLASQSHKLAQANDSGMSAPVRSSPSIDLPTDGNHISSSSKSGLLYDSRSGFAGFSSLQERAIASVARLQSANQPTLISLRI